MSGDTQQQSATAFGASIQHWLTVYLKGVAMGAADSVPGVSGGTIAFITGIYERLITAITQVDPTAVALLSDVHRREGRRALLDRIVEMDLPFLMVLGVGVATAIVTVSRVVHAALQQAEAVTFAFFFGLIAASAIVLYDQLSVDTPGQFAAGLLGFAIAFFVSGITAGTDVAHTLPIIFGAGSIAIVAMILPGVSGAFFLLLLGQYEYLTGVLKDFVDLFLSVLVGNRSVDSLLEPATTVVTFGVGAVIGLFTVAHAIRWALDNYRRATLSFLVSLMVGALRLPVEKVAENTRGITIRPELSLDVLSVDPGAISLLAVVGLVVAATIGAGAVLALDRYTDDLDY